MSSIRKILASGLVAGVAAAGVIVTTAVPASGAAFPGCTVHDPVVLCVQERDTIFGPLSVAPPDIEGTDIGNVVAYLDLYERNLGVTTATIACVTLAEPAAASPCANLGFTLTSRSPLVDSPVTAYTAEVLGSYPVATVWVCRGTLTATVAGVGVTNTQIFTVCA